MTDYVRGRRWAASRTLPFVESFKGSYTHRVRSAILYNIHAYPHMAVRCWCGMTVLISPKGCHSKNSFVERPSNRPMCATCEGRVIGAVGVDDFRINEQLVRYAPRNGFVTTIGEQA